MPSLRSLEIGFDFPDGKKKDELDPFWKQKSELFTKIKSLPKLTSLNFSIYCHIDKEEDDPPTPQDIRIQKVCSQFLESLPKNQISNITLKLTTHSSPLLCFVYMVRLL